MQLHSRQDEISITTKLIGGELKGSHVSPHRAEHLFVVPRLRHGDTLDLQEVVLHLQ